MLVHIATVVEALAVILLFVRGVARRYITFTVYLSLVLVGDIFWSYLGPAVGFTYEMGWYYNLFWLNDSLEHVLKIFVVVGFYRILLEGYRHLRLMVDFFFYGICSILILLFVFNFNFSATFLYNTSIYLGKYTFLFVFIVGVLLLVLVSTSGIQADITFLLLLFGFTFFGLTQSLNFFFLTADHERMSSFWGLCYQYSYWVPLLCWLAAAVVPVRAEKKTFAWGGAELQAQLVAGMLALDRQAGRILKALFPART